MHNHVMMKQGANEVTTLRRCSALGFRQCLLQGRAPHTSRRNEKKTSKRPHLPPYPRKTRKLESTLKKNGPTKTGERAQHPPVQPYKAHGNTVLGSNVQEETSSSAKSLSHNAISIPSTLTMLSRISSVCPTR